MRKIKYKALAVFIIAFALVMVACGSDSDNSTSEPVVVFDKGGQLEYIFDNGILQQIELVKNSTESFKLLIETYKESPTEDNFEDLKENWKELILAWKPLETITIGDFALTSKVVAIHFWPFDVALLQTNIENYTEESFEINATAKGLGAIEYILFSKDYQTFFGDENHTKASAYLGVLIDDVISVIDSYETAWLEYEEEFKTSTKTGVTGTQNQLLNEIVFTFFDIIVDKIQSPIVSNSEETEFLTSETPYSEFSLDIIEAQIVFVEQLFSGNLSNVEVSFSIYDQLIFVDRDDLVEVIQNQFDTIRIDLSSTTETLENLITSGSEDLTQIEESISFLHTLISNDIFSALSITTTVGDNDGDS